jgi:hypothetical protein
MLAALKEHLDEVHVVAIFASPEGEEDSAASVAATEAEAFLRARCGLRRLHRCTRDFPPARLAAHLRAEGEVLDLALLVVMDDDHDDEGGLRLGEERLLREAFDSLEPLAQHLALLGPPQQQDRWHNELSRRPGFCALRLHQQGGEEQRKSRRRRSREEQGLLLLLRQHSEDAAALAVDRLGDLF